jgi:hypothetical protein
VYCANFRDRDKSWVDVLEEFKVQVGDAEYHQIQLTDTITLLEDRCKELTSLSKDSQLIDTIDRLILKFGPIGTLAASIAPSNPEVCWLVWGSLQCLAAVGVLRNSDY